VTAGPGPPGPGAAAWQNRIWPDEPLPAAACQGRDPAWGPTPELARRRSGSRAAALLNLRRAARRICADLCRVRRPAACFGEQLVDEQRGEATPWRGLVAVLSPARRPAAGSKSPGQAAWPTACLRTPAGRASAATNSSRWELQPAGLRRPGAEQRSGQARRLGLAQRGGAGAGRTACQPGCTCTRAAAPDSAIRWGPPPAPAQPLGPRPCGNLKPARRCFSLACAIDP